MRTRVIRYWHQTEWLYKVEKYVQATGEEQWTCIGEPDPNAPPNPKAGEWYWTLVAAPLAFKKAFEVARSLSNGQQPDLTDVAAEFNDGEQTR